MKKKLIEKKEFEMRRESRKLQRSQIKKETNKGRKK